MFGACVGQDMLGLVTEYCLRDSLEDIIVDEEKNLDDLLKYALLFDLINVSSLIRI